MKPLAEGSSGPKHPVEWFAIVSLALGLLRFVFQVPLFGTLLGLISGVVAFVRLKETNNLVGKLAATLGILLALLILARFSVILFVSQARESARIAQCANNEREILKAIKIYAVYDGKCPEKLDDLRPYLQSQHNLICPMERTIQDSSYILMCDTNTPNGVMIRESRNRHFGGSNIAYADGRAVWEPGTDTNYWVIRHWRLLFWPERRLDFLAY